VEGSNWLRISAILAMVLGSTYVLLPTILAEDTDKGGVVAGERMVKQEGVLDAWFVAEDGDPDVATVDVVRKRLSAGGIAVEGVAVEEGRVEVSLRTGTDPRLVERAVVAPGRPALYGAPAIAGYDEAVTDPAGLEIGLAGKPVAADAAPLEATVVGATLKDGVLTASVSGAIPAGMRPVLVIDGAAVGRLEQAPAVEGAEPAWQVELVGNEQARSVAKALLIGGSVPEGLRRWVAEVKEEAADADAAVVELAWWEGMLPDTKLNLGLDLQGGIDLTLQVDQEEAVFAQVQRDRDALRDQALRDGLTLNVSRERSRPAMRVSYDGEFAKLKEYLGQNLRDYAYVETLETDKGSEHVWLMLEQRVKGIESSAVEQVLETLRKRVDSTGVKEPAIVQMGGGRINIQLPGMADPQQALDAIGTQAVLEFRMVDMEAGDPTEMLDAAAAALPPKQFEDDLNEWLHAQGMLPEDRVLMYTYDENEAGDLVRGQAIQVKDKVLLTGGDVNNAGVSWDQNNQPMVLLDFKPAGASVFCDVTTTNVGKPFAIILDGQVRSAPRINEPICGGRASINMDSGADPTKDANNLALVLRTGSLTAPVDPGEIRHIGPSLGADAITSGVLGAGIGGLLTVIVMLLWYRKAGAVAVVALSLNVLMVFAMLALFGATLTLPGIAGVALTVGMAVDANIIVYERIREELALGVSPRKAVDMGFEKGVTAVIDANLTTAIAGIVLYSYGTGPIRGFAVTLLIGIFTTIITGVYVSKWLMEMMTRNSNSRLAI
jgi:preprotein translocase subunit SecD